MTGSLFQQEIEFKDILEGAEYVWNIVADINLRIGILLVWV
jgi:hypothetical protein